MFRSEPQIRNGGIQTETKPLEAVIPVIQESVREIRRIQMNLRPAILDDLGILATISWFCREYETTHSNIQIEKKIDLQEHEIPEPLKMAIYRIMQEGMTNITRHSGASLVLLSFRKRDSRIELVVQDNGRGFDLQEAHSSEDSRRGLGLVSMRERAEHSGGSFSIESAKGLWLRTTEGRSILDAESGTFNLPLGYFHDAVERAVQRQINSVSFIPSDLDHEQIQLFMKKLENLGRPFGLTSMLLRDLTGSTANECAIKLSQLYTGKQGIISFDRSHHGQTIATTAISGSPFRREGIPANTVPYAHHAPLGAEIVQLENIIRSSDIAAIIIEPVLGNGGNLFHPPGYFQALRELCDEHDILLIVDEVQTGIGRTGEQFGSTALGIQPDVMTLAKGLANGYPIGAVLFRPELNILKKYHHSFTSGSHLVSIAAANATLEEIGKDGFLEGVRQKSGILKQGLEYLKEKHACISDVRGIGFMWGMEIVSSSGEPDVETTNAIVQHGIEKHDLRLRSSQYCRGNVVKVRPALIASEEELHEIIKRLDASICEAV